MKKIFLAMCMVFFTCLNVQAVQYVRFNNAGAPISTSYGYNYRNPYNYGYNAPYRYSRRLPAQPRYYYTPRYPAVTRSAYNRYFNPYRMGYYNPYYGYGIPRRYSVNYTPVSRREPMSHLDKNYIVPSNYYQRVTCGGVTYYGKMNPCK